MNWYAVILSLLLQGVWLIPCAKASEADLEWKDAMGAVKEGETDVAYLDFNSILALYPESDCAMAATFAVGEYHFQHGDFQLAAEQFKNFSLKYNKNQQALAALVYLYKIAQIENDPVRMKEYQADVASFRQNAFIFSDKKHFSFSTGFKHHYKMVYAIDKVGLYVNGQPLAEVPF
jgi:hypothetical protein